MNFSNIIRGIGGEPEIIRTLGAVGMLAYIVAAVGFTFWMVVIQGKDFDIVAFCTAFSGGLVAIYVGIAGAAAVKDRNVSVAKVTQETGSAPGLAAGTPGEPIEATIVNKADDPVPTTTKDKGK